MRYLMVAFCALLIAGLIAPPNPALAQAGTPAQALTTCGTPVNSPVNGGYYSLTTDLKGNLCVSGQTGTSAQQVQGTSASGATDDGSNPVKMGCVGAVNVTPPGPLNGQRGNILCSGNGAVGISVLNGINGTGFVTLSNGTTVNGGGVQSLSVDPTGESWAEITTATSTLVKGGPGYLHNVCVNTPVASATIKAYNAVSATGTPFTITLPSTITGESPFCMIYDVAFPSGIFVVTSGATDVTVTYR